MKKFICIMPETVLESHVYEAVGNKQLFDKDTTRFPLIPLLTGYTENDEEMQVIAITAKDPAKILCMTLALGEEEDEGEE